MTDAARATFAPDDAPAVPLTLVAKAGLEAALAALPPAHAAWARAAGFSAAVGEAVALPGSDGAPVAALAGWGDAASRAVKRWPLAAAAAALPRGDYALVADGHDIDVEAEALGWLMHGYRFSRRRAAPPDTRRGLKAPAGVDAARVQALADAVALGRDLVNTPANEMGPEALEAAARALAEAHGAAFETTAGAALQAGFPLIAAVGRAAAQAPRLLDLRWGRADAPKVTLVGKGVCFDTGGLDLKPAAAMRLMKKDMGGAAAALATAAAVMATGLDVRLRVLIPAVENSVSAAAFRPGDVLTSRKGLTVEIGNTDAEGRLVLADALTLAGEEEPALTIDFATLTGAARVALGPDLPALFTPDDSLAADLAAAGARARDPLWRLPLWPGYEPMLEAPVADLDNAPPGGMAGAITAALFLGRFAPAHGVWAHLDLYAWTPAAAPGRPKGGEAQTALAVHAMLSERFG